MTADYGKTRAKEGLEGGNSSFPLTKPHFSLF